MRNEGEKEKDGCVMLTEEQLGRAIAFLKTAGRIALVTAAYEIMPIFPFKEGRAEAHYCGPCTSCTHSCNCCIWNCTSFRY